MMYLLTKEEFDRLRSDAKNCRDSQTAALQAVCTLAANHVPVRRPWNSESDDPRPWGCILNPDKKTSPGYCDECPVQDACPYEHKRWSK